MRWFLFFISGVGFFKGSLFLKNTYNEKRRIDVNPSLPGFLVSVKWSAVAYSGFIVEFHQMHV